MTNNQQLNATANMLRASLIYSMLDDQPSAVNIVRLTDVKSQGSRAANVASVIKDVWTGNFAKNIKRIRHNLGFHGAAKPEAITSSSLSTDDMNRLHLLFVLIELWMRSVLPGFERASWEESKWNGATSNDSDCVLAKRAANLLGELGLNEKSDALARVFHAAESEKALE